VAARALFLKHRLNVAREIGRSRQKRQGRRDYGNPNTRTAAPAATATYCLPFAANVIGEVRQG